MNRFWIITIIIVLVFLIYMAIPSIWYRSFSKITLKSVDPRTIAITFDDGPDLNITPKLLDELKRLGLKVTFLVIGSSALANKNIIRREIKEGHEVALHSMNHRCHWTLGPFGTYRDVKSSVETIRNLGGDPKFFRPPWGLYNLFTVLACKKYGLRCAHWSLHAFDWSAWTKTEDIVNIISSKMQSGQVILLHDGRGKNNAPQRTLAAISSIADAIINKNLVNTTLNSKEVNAK